MRKTRTTTLAAVAAALLILCLPGSVSAQDAYKIGVFDAQRVSAETAEGKRVQGELNKFKTAKEAEIKAVDDELIALQDQLSSQALSLSSERQALLMKDIQRKRLDLDRLRSEATQDLQLEIAEAQAIFQEKLLMAVDRFGRDREFTLILEASQVVFADGSVDVTTAVVDLFDKMFPAAGGGG